MILTCGNGNKRSAVDAKESADIFQMSKEREQWRTKGRLWEKSCAPWNQSPSDMISVMIATVFTGRKRDGGFGGQRRIYRWLAYWLLGQKWNTLRHYKPKDLEQKNWRITISRRRCLVGVKPTELTRPPLDTHTVSVTTAAIYVYGGIWQNMCYAGIRQAQPSRGWALCSSYRDIKVELPARAD